MSNRTDIVVETDNAEGQVLLSASRVYDLTEDKTQDTINSEVGSTLTSLGNTLNHLEDGLAIIVNGDTCTTAVPVKGYAYIKNNTHGLAEGLYTNTSASAFPTSGGTANSSVFTSVSGGGLNSLNSSVKTLNGYVNGNGLNKFINKSAYYENTTLSAIKSEFDSAYGSVWTAIVFIFSCTGMPTITSGAVLMVKSGGSASARCLAFDGTKIETAIISQ